MVEDNLLSVANAIFKNRKEYVNMPDIFKEKYCFMINRYFSKIYPEYAILLNHKNCDKKTIMDCWFHFMENKPFPKLFWSKSGIKTEKNITKNDIKILSEKLEISEQECKNLIMLFPEETENELKKLKK